MKGPKSSYVSPFLRWVWMFHWWITPGRHSSVMVMWTWFLEKWIETITPRSIIVSMALPFQEVSGWLNVPISFPSRSIEVYVPQERKTRYMKLAALPIVCSFCDSLKLDAAAHFWMILEMFGCSEFHEELEGNKIHLLTNILTLSHEAHYMFDSFQMWFEEMVRLSEALSYSGSQYLPLGNAALISDMFSPLGWGSHTSW